MREALFIFKVEQELATRGAPHDKVKVFVVLGAVKGVELFWFLELEKVTDFVAELIVFEKMLKSRRVHLTNKLRFQEKLCSFMNWHMLKYILHIGSKLLLELT